MSIVERPPPARSEDQPDVEALEALIEEARQRARRRRRGYAIVALVAVAAGLLGFSVVNEGDVTRPSDETGAVPQPTDGEWRPAPGLDGGMVTAFAIHPRRPDIIFASTLEAGVFRSANGGRQWRHLDLGPAVSRVDALAVAPSDPDTVYAGAGQGVLKTADGGRTWRATDADLLGRETPERRAHRAIEGYVYALAVDPRDAAIVYAGTWENGLFKTVNGGRTWRSLRPDAAVNALALHRQTSTIYAGVEDGVVKSSDGGVTWQQTGLQGEYVMTLALDPNQPGTIYASTNDRGVFRTADGGANWRRVGLEGEGISSVALDPSARGVVYAATWEKGLLKTEDAGRSWRQLGAGASSAAVALDPRDPATIYLASRRGAADGRVAKSADGGRSWRPADTGLTAARVSALALDPGSPGTAYAAIDGRGIVKRVDGTWRDVSTGLTAPGVHALAVDPQNPATLFAATDEGVFKSTNGGGVWRGLGTVTEPAVAAVAVDPRTSATVYALTINEGLIQFDGTGTIYESRVFKTTDGGRIWPRGVQVQAVPASGTSPRRTIGREAPLAVDPLNPDVLYAGGPGLAKSIDGGRTWRPAGIARRPVRALAVDPEQAGVVYAGTDAGLLKSTDGGASWQRLHGAIDGQRVEALAIDPADRQTVLAGTGTGVFWSVDGGDHWRRFTRLPRRPFHALAVDRSAGVVYAGAYGGGIYELQLGTP